MGYILVERTCPFCKRQYLKAFDFDGYLKYRDGMAVQDAFPDRSVDDREFLVSGICPNCWDLTFGGEDCREKLDRLHTERESNWNV